MKRNIKMVVFDMAGTTVRDKNEVEYCFLQAVDQTGLVTNPDEINSMMGWSKLTVFETLWKKQLAGATVSEINDRVEKSYSAFREVLESHYLNSEILPTEGTLEIFEFLKRQNIQIALTTGFYRKVTDIILERLGWSVGLDKHGSGNGIVDASVSSDEVKAGRPAPFMVFRAMELCNVNDVRKIIKIGDTPSDLGEGKNAGCYLSLGVTNGTHTKEQLSRLENDGLFENMTEFQKFLEKLL
jgi:phosphonatase-like hydrolase